jgi:hypothetical protein
MDALRPVLGIKLGHCHIHSRLRDRVARSVIYFPLVGEVQVGETSSQADNLLGPTLKDLRHKEVNKVDVPYNINIKGLF